MAFRSVHDFTVKNVRGEDVKLGDYKGKVLLMVNAKSESDLTHPDHTEMARMLEKYKHHGLEILPFPFKQVDVHGPNAAPIHEFLKSSSGRLEWTDTEWNLAKFLVDTDGNILEHYIPTPSDYDKHHEMVMRHSPVEANPITQVLENDIKKHLGIA